MTNIHPKVGVPALVGFGWTVVCLAIAQYAPYYAPNDALTAAIGTFLMALAGYIVPSPTAAQPPVAG